MPTLLELFQTQKLSNGQTAAQKYEVQNSKENKPSSANGILNATIFPLQQIARRNLSNRTDETLIEEETTGLRVLNTLASPVIYGTQIIRLTSQTTKEVDDMNAAANGTNAFGLLSGVLNIVRDAPAAILSKIGMPLPQDMIPTRVVNNTKFTAASSLETMTVLSDIKKDGAGSLLGKFIAQNAQGNPSQIGNQLVGGAIQAGKDVLKNILLGSRKEGQKNIANIQPSLNVAYRNEYGRPAINTDGNFQIFSYQHLVNSDVNPYSSTIDELSDDESSRNDLSSVLANLTAPILQKSLPQRNNKSQKYNYDVRYEDYQYKNEIGDDISKNALDVKRGFNFNYTDDENLIVTGSYGDTLNKVRTYKDSTDAKTKLNEKTNVYLEDLDFVSLKFYSVAKGAFVPFRATISGLTETFTPSWESNKYIGSPFNFYTYSSIERSVSFKFVVYSLSLEEHKAAWDRIRFLTSLVYSQGFGSNSRYVVPPFIRFSLGDLYNKKFGFIESLSYTIDDNTPWEIGLNGTDSDKYKLPTMINVDITIKFVESASTIGTFVPNAGFVNVNLYGFGSPSIDRANNIDGSGVVIPAELPKQNPSEQNKGGAGSNILPKPNISPNLFTNSPAESLGYLRGSLNNTTPAKTELKKPSKHKKG